MVTLHVCLNHTDDGIHSDHDYLDTWEIPGGPPYNGVYIASLAPNHIIFSMDYLNLILVFTVYCDNTYIIK